MIQGMHSVVYMIYLVLVIFDPPFRYYSSISRYRSTDSLSRILGMSNRDEDLGIPLSDSDAKLSKSSGPVMNIFRIADPREEYFVINNLSKGAPLEFSIECHSSRQRGAQFMLPEFNSNSNFEGMEILSQGEMVLPKCIPSSGSILPGGSMKIAVTLCG